MAQTIANNKTYRAQNELEAAAKDPTKVGLSDIDEIVQNHKDGGKSMDVVHLDFELVDRDENDDKKKQRWRHKLTDRLF